MRYKTYRGRTRTEAVAKARIDLGNGFYIVTEEEIKTGLFGKNKEVEITVGLLETYFSEDGTIRKETTDIAIPPEIEEVIIKEKTTDIDLITVEDAESLSEKYDNLIENDKKSITHFKEPNDNLYGNSYIENKKVLEKFLRYGDFDDNFIDSFINEVSTNVALKNIKNIDEIFRNENLFEEVKRLLSNYVKRKVLTFNGIEVNRGRSKAITFIGPTGEGKTTTLVKLACGYLIEDKCELKIISLDYYRIAAKEQLNYYADVLMQPFEFYNDIDIFRKECDLTGKDVILIDTAGRGQKDHKELLELKKYLNLVHIDLVKCLVLSATKKYYDMKEIIRNFDEEIGIDNIILTKIDETNSLGQALSVLAETGKPLTYITDGQAVPENIHKADINGLININFTKMLDRYKDTW